MIPTPSRRNSKRLACCLHILLWALVTPSVVGQVSPPQSNSLVLWFDASQQSTISTDDTEKVIRWDNLAPSTDTLALLTGTGMQPPVLQSTTDPFGHTVLFNGDSVLHLHREIADGEWEPASFTTTDGLAVFVVSRGPVVSDGNDVTLQSLVGWTQNSWRNSILRPYRTTTNLPVAYPGGDCHFYYGSGNPVFITDVLIGSKISGTGTYINRVAEAEIAEVLFYDQGLTEAERKEVLVWLHARHRLSTDTTNPTAGRDPRLTPLKESVPANSGFHIAAAGNTNFFRENADISKNPALDRYACTEATLERHYQMITPTNDFKMVRAAPDFSVTDLTASHDWSMMDPYIEWVHARGIEWHGHVLVWHKGIPTVLANSTWLGGAWTEAQLRNLMTDHINQMVGRYTPEGVRSDLAGTVTVWDVVNEAIGPAWNHIPDPSNPSDWKETLRSSIWHDGGDGPGGRPGIGPDFIEEAFTLAEAASGSDEITLLYNDFGAEEIGIKSNAIYKMCVDLINRDIPIDGIGLQMHLNLYGIDLDSFRANIERFRALRGGTFEVHITELDIGIPGLVTREKLEEQGQWYYDIVTTALEAGANSLHTWGIHDIWTSVERGYSASLPFSDAMRIAPATPYPGPLPADHPSRRLSYIEPKPAFYGVLNAIRDHFNSADRKIRLSDLSSLGENRFSMTVHTHSPGIIDILAEDNLNHPFELLGFEGNWESTTVEEAGAHPLTFTDPEETDSPRFWRVIFSPRK